MVMVLTARFAHLIFTLPACLMLVLLSITTHAFAQSDAGAPTQIAEEARLNIEQGRIQLQNSNYAASVTTLSGVIRNEKVPSEWLAIAFFYRGIANRSQSKNEAAITDFVNALWLRTLPDPIIAQTHFHRALAYAALRKFDEAMADFDVAQRLAPDEQSIKDSRESVRAYMNGETTGSIAGVPISPEDAIRNALGNGAALAPTTYGNRPRSVVPSSPGRQEAVLPPPDTKPTSTGSVDPPPQTAGAANSGYRIQLGALGSRQLAESAWVSAREQHLDLLGNMKPSYENITRAGKTVTRLRAGFAPSAIAARNLCAQLIKRGQECIVVTR